MATVAAGRSRSGSIGGYWLIGAAYVAVYVGLDWLSYNQAFSNLGITPWNLPPGVSLALLLRGGMRFLPWLYPATAIADLLVRDNGVPVETILITSLIITSGYGIAAYVLRNAMQLQSSMSTLRDLLCLVLVTVAVVAAIAVGYVGVYVLEGLLPPMDLERAAVRFWVGDVIGVISVTPLLLRQRYWSLSATLASARTMGPEFMLQGLAIASALWLVFGIERSNQFQYFYVMFLPVLWIALRHGLDGVVIAVFVTQAGMIALIQYGNYETTLATQFQVRMIALCVTGLVTGAVVRERERAEAARLEGEARLRRLQAQLDQVGRSSAIGELASAIAHEMSQPLSAINAYLGTCRRQFAKIENANVALGETLDKAHAQAQRASTVLTRLREFFRRGELTLERVPLRDIVADALELAREEAVRAGVSMRIDRSITDRIVMVDRVQIGQVLLNLIRNAITAIAQARGRHRVVTIWAEELAGEVAVRVSDTGPGVPEDMVEELFWPLGHSRTGMGLGLAICRTIVEAHGGKIRYEPAQDGGACFVFTLPRGEDEPT